MGEVVKWVKKKAKENDVGAILSLLVVIIDSFLSIKSHDLFITPGRDEMKGT